MVEAAVGLQDVMTVARATKVKEMHNRELISKKNRRWQIWRRGATGMSAPLHPHGIYCIGLLGGRPFLKAFRHFAESGFLNDVHFKTTYS